MNMLAVTRATQAVNNAADDADADSEEDDDDIEAFAKKAVGHASVASKSAE